MLAGREDRNESRNQPPPDPQTGEGERRERERILIVTKDPLHIQMTNSRCAHAVDNSRSVGSLGLSLPAEDSRKIGGSIRKLACLLSSTWFTRCLRLCPAGCPSRSPLSLPRPCFCLSVPCAKEFARLQSAGYFETPGRLPAFCCTVLCLIDLPTRQLPQQAKPLTLRCWTNEISPARHVQKTLPFSLFSVLCLSFVLRRATWFVCRHEGQERDLGPVCHRRLEIQQPNSRQRELRA